MITKEKIKSIQLTEQFQIVTVKATGVLASGKSKMGVVKQVASLGI